jgi:hypothetical protein
VNWSFLKREWGAVTFVLTVFLGAIIVPIALIIGHQPPPVAAGFPGASPSPTVSASASAPRTTSPSP